MAPWLVNILTSAVVTGLLGGLAWWLLRSWAGARIKGEVDTHYAKELESHKANLRTRTDSELERFREELDRERSLRTAAKSAFDSAHTAAAERRLLAVQVAWEAVVEFRERAESLMRLFDIFSRSELSKALGDPKMAQAIGAPTDADVVDMAKLWRRAEPHRPFLDEPLWALVYGYQLLLGRILVTMKMGREAGRIAFWIDDAHTKHALTVLLGQASAAEIEKLQIGGISRAIHLIELRILEEARRTVSGVASSDAALQQARTLLELSPAPKNPSFIRP